MGAFLSGQSDRFLYIFTLLLGRGFPLQGSEIPQLSSRLGSPFSDSTGVLWGQANFRLFLEAIFLLISRFWHFLSADILTQFSPFCPVYLPDLQTHWNVSNSHVPLSDWLPEPSDARQVAASLSSRSISWKLGSLSAGRGYFLPEQ